MISHFSTGEIDNYCGLYVEVHACADVQFLLQPFSMFSGMGIITVLLHIWCPYMDTNLSKYGPKGGKMGKIV